MVKKKILFVCTGNSCRSVMAEGLLQDLLNKRGHNDVQVLSAGTNTFNGMPPSAETVAVMKENSIDIARHVGQQLTTLLIERADLIFCMEEFHMKQILDAVPEAKPKVFLLNAFENPTARHREIPDPIGRSAKVYQVCRDVILEAVTRVADWIEKHQGE